MIKNRISAQKSRDRKKGEFSELMNANQLLSDENTNLSVVLKRLQNEADRVRKLFISALLEPQRQQMISVMSDFTLEQRKVDRVFMRK